MPSVPWMARLAAFAALVAVSACGPKAIAPARVAAPATGPTLMPAALVAWWDAHHVPLPPAPLIAHADVVAAAAKAVAADAGHVTREVIGQSVEGRDLLHLAIGTGPTHVLLWSQMHGDEASATPALFDLLEWIRRERGSAAATRIEAQLTVHLVPMLNPDGAERFQRRNAQGIDVNRDALLLQTPEGRALKALRDRVRPALGFNLHNQNGQTSAGTPPRPATISLLAVAHDQARSDSPRRTVAKQTAALVREALEPLIPGQVGRYDDAFEVRAFGDNLGIWGTAVVLIESGPLQGADAEPALTRLNFAALVTALDALASGRTATHATTAYDTLPVNDSNLFRLKVHNATIVQGTATVPPFRGDVGINVSRAVIVRDGARALEVTARIADLGDLRVYGALEDVDGSGLTLTPAFDPQARQGDIVRLPDWASWRGPTLTVGQPGRLFLLQPAGGSPAAATGEGSGNWRLIRTIDPGTARP